MTFLPLLWSSLWRKKVRTIFTLLSIFVAFLLFGLLMTIRGAFSFGVEIAGIDRLVLIHKISLIMPLPVSYLPRLNATEKGFVEGFAKQVGDIGAIMIAITVAVLFTMILVAANTMAQSVRERTSEVGVLKTLGFSNTSILALVLGESVLIVALGLLAGVLPALNAMHLKITDALRRA